ncbi:MULTISPECIES: type II toxin-antitoxin system HicB family antitoxin [Halomonas]|uniref:Type II toxin-antitoxin system HicB family antitoxin n=2 Tax=Halomonas TaxID=2745 RepID=A0ABT6V1J3_9GAMM|nr:MULTISPECIES: type II toxin-antitoxin system HicB family antitoxin [Halomonas]MDI5891348.1 type II toxin-antitoxin system HicB family antitoxin [Halomonas rhizosphaerae]TDR57216.1 putative RNase H-like HicB family nuclease [Halomonas ventosae]WFM69831.1 type II toxin-antitoxin system HicB family antitoxin [Halomonas sp. CKK8]
MQYPIAIEWGDENTATGIVFPDIPGAISAGDTPEEAYDNAVEAAHIVLQEMVARGEPVPKPGRIDEHRRNPDFEGWGWGMIDIDLTPYLGKAEKVTVTLPGTVLRQIDEYVTLHGVKSRSTFLSNAALEKLRHL